MTLNLYYGSGSLKFIVGTITSFQLWFFLNMVSVLMKQSLKYYIHISTDEVFIMLI